jgi:hypothetical protein
LLAARLILTGACPAHPALVRDHGATRDKLLGEAAACSGDLWLESVRIRTALTLDLDALRARADAVGLLVRGIETSAGDRLGDAAKQYAAAMLNRASGLRPALGEDHPAVRAAGGELPAELIARAKSLLLARLAEGG